MSYTERTITAQIYIAGWEIRQAHVDMYFETNVFESYTCSALGKGVTLEFALVRAEAQKGTTMANIVLSLERRGGAENVYLSSSLGNTPNSLFTTCTWLDFVGGRDEFRLQLQIAYDHRVSTGPETSPADANNLAYELHVRKLYTGNSRSNTSKNTPLSHPQHIHHLGADHAVHRFRRVRGGLVPDDVVTTAVVGPCVVWSGVQLVRRLLVQLCHFLQMAIEYALGCCLCCLVDVVTALLRTGKR